MDQNQIASVEDLRALLIELLDEVQGRLKGAATDPADVFYSGTKRVNENTARNRIVDMLEARLSALNLGVVVEHQMAAAKRCDFTASTSINGYPVLLVTEVKGQWNRELWTAASVQLAKRYTIYPGAAHQGVYLIIWFGGDVTIAGKKEPSISKPAQLRLEIIKRMPAELRGRIDVYVLDVSRSKRTKKPRVNSARKAKRKPAKAAGISRGKSSKKQPASKSRLKQAKARLKPGNSLKAKKRPPKPPAKSVKKSRANAPGRSRTRRRATPRRARK